MWEEKFGQRLAQLREQKEVSAREMSLAIGQGPAYINNIENQHNMPSMLAFFYICDYLKITPSEFFDDENINPIKTQEFTLGFQRLSPEHQDNVLSLIKGLHK